MSTLVIPVLLWQGQHDVLSRSQAGLLGPGRGSVCLSWGSYDHLVLGKWWLLTVWVGPRVPANVFGGANWSFLCHWFVGGIILNIKWLEGVFYAALNTCTAKNLPHVLTLQLVNELFLSVHSDDCGKDAASCPKLQLEDFVSQVYANGLSQRR